MKISDGNWLMQEGLNLVYPLEIQSTETVNDKEAIVYAAPHTRCDQRDSSVDSPLLKLILTTPAEGVIGLRWVHHEGKYETGPEFKLITDSNAKAQIKETDSHFTFDAGCLSAKFAKGKQWAFDVLLNGKKVTGSEEKNTGHIHDTNTKRKYMFERLDMDVGTLVYGLGERFTHFVKNGQRVEVWNRDGGTSTEQAYKNVPFYITNRGYGVFVNHPDHVDFEIGSEKVSKVQFSVESEYLEYYIIAGPTPKDVLNRYTALTGRPPLPPAWSFGLWLSTSFTTNYDEKTVTSFVQGFKDRKLPLHVFHFDCFWMKEYEWCNLTWDERQFPDPKGMLSRLHNLGLQICVWINPYVGQKSPMFKEGKDNGYLLKRPDGSVWQWDKWQAGCAVIDFTNPGAVKWYQDKLRALMEMGVDAFKTDFAERIPLDVVYHDKSEPAKMHNYYSYLYNQVVWQVLVEKKGENGACVFARAGTAGSQTMPVHWGGDCYGNYPSMHESLRGGLSIGCSGFGFWSHDIGGFENTAPPHVYKRWAAWGLLSSHSRLHGSKSYRVPWAYDEESNDVVRTFTQWKCRLMPYIMNSAVQAHTAGTPVMRAMMIEYPEDLVCQTLDAQYAFGDELVVAPVFAESGEVNFYLPNVGKTGAEEWTHMFDNSSRKEGKYYTETYGCLSIPIFAKPNSVIPVGASDQEVDYDYANGVCFHVFQQRDGSTLKTPIHNKQGKLVGTFTITRNGNTYTANADGDIKDWSVNFRSHNNEVVKQFATHTF